MDKILILEIASILQSIAIMILAVTVIVLKKAIVRMYNGISSVLLRYLGSDPRMNQKFG